MKDHSQEGNALRKARVAAGLSQPDVRAAVLSLDPSLTMGNTMIYDIESGRAGVGDKSIRIRNLMWQVIKNANPATAVATKKVEVKAPVAEAKKITVTAAGFSIEASTAVVKQLATLGVPTDTVKATLVKTFADLLDQAEK